MASDGLWRCLTIRMMASLPHGGNTAAAGGTAGAAAAVAAATAAAATSSGGGSVSEKPASGVGVGAIATVSAMETIEAAGRAAAVADGVVAARPGESRSPDSSVFCFQGFSTVMSRQRCAYVRPVNMSLQADCCRHTDPPLIRPRLHMSRIHKAFFGPGNERRRNLPNMEYRVLWGFGGVASMVAFFFFLTQIVSSLHPSCEKQSFQGLAVSRRLLLPRQPPLQW